MGTLISRVFNNGNSQAVRIPADFRLDADQVEITRTADGDLLIHPLRKRRGDAIQDTLNAFDEEFATLLEEDRTHQPVMQDRESL
ncbi:antitoxin [Pistricoccus aurantiacus]|uniref:antitoxin n=1 Tax=Pistricoccus aurantiacus TaxID=1883414 RepID=UPI0036356012